MQMGRCCHCPTGTVLEGRIYRFVYPSFPADYAAIATASWSSGTTGNATEDFNCRYVTLTTPDQRATSTELITDPVRWAVYGPASDGGTFDYWVANSGANATYLRNHQFIPAFKIPVTDGMLPSASHADWVAGELALVASDPFTGTGLPVPTSARTTEPNLYNGSAIVSGMTIYAFAHRVNGSVVGGVNVTPFADADYVCPISYGDTYELDIWYKMTFTASASYPATAGTFNRWLHTTRVSNGSRRISNSLLPAGLRYVLSFRNVNFSPSFDPETQTYQISISGHSGWTLLSGSNGPMTIQNYTGVWFGNVGSGFAELFRDVSASHPIYTIRLTWSSEIALVAVQLWSDQFYYNNYGAWPTYYYRSTTASPAYRTQTSSTDLGDVSHTNHGYFNQSGTTVFEYIPWNVGVVGSYIQSLISDGAYSNASLPTKPAELPQTITFTRIARAVSEQIYTSGSGTFIVPAGVFLLTRELWGPGGGGAAGVAGGGNRSGSGGSGGGYCKKNASSVTPGQAIAYSVGVPGTGGTYDNDDSTAGTATTTDGGTYTANGGGRGRFGGGVAADAPGTASGGDINTTGTIGATNPTNTIGGAGGAGANGGAGGAGAVPGAALAQNGTVPGGGGGGGGDNGIFGGGDTADGADGGSGKIRFSW